MKRRSNSCLVVMMVSGLLYCSAQGMRTRSGAPLDAKGAVNELNKNIVKTADELLKMSADERRKYQADMEKWLGMIKGKPAAQQFEGRYKQITGLWNTCATRQANLEKQLGEVRTELETTRQRLTGAGTAGDADIEQLKQKHAAALQKVEDEKAAAVKAEQDKFAKAQQEYEAAQKVYQDEFKKEQEKVAALEKVKKELNAKMGVASGKISSLELQLQTDAPKQAQLNALKEAAKKLQAELEKEKAACAAAQGEKGGVAEKLAACDKARKEAEEKATRSQGILQAIASANIGFKIEDKDPAAFINAVKAYEKESADYKKRLDQMTDAGGNLVTQLEAKEQEVKDLTDQLDQRDKSIKEKDESIKAKNDEIGTLKKTQAGQELQNKITELEKENAVLKERIEEGAAGYNPWIN